MDDIEKTLFEEWEAWKRKMLKEYNACIDLDFNHVENMAVLSARGTRSGYNQYGEPRKYDFNASLQSIKLI